MIGKGTVRSYIESFIPHFNLTEIISVCWFVISFVYVPTKNAKPIKPLLEGGGGGKGKGHMYDSNVQ